MRPAFFVGERMDFCRPSAARAANGLALLPPFAPAAERWALTAELSIIMSAGGGVVTLLKIGRSIVGIRSNGHAAATTSRHACMADALKARCVLADVRWRCTLKVL
jgi:hypothetical protein